MNPAPTSAFFGRPRFRMSEAQPIVEPVLEVTPGTMSDQLPRLELVRTCDPLVEVPTAWNYY